MTVRQYNEQQTEKIQRYLESHGFALIEATKFNGGRVFEIPIPYEVAFINYEQGNESQIIGNADKIINLEKMAGFYGDIPKKITQIKMNKQNW